MNVHEDFQSEIETEALTHETEASDMPWDPAKLLAAHLRWIQLYLGYLRRRDRGHILLVYDASDDVAVCSFSAV